MRRLRRFIPLLLIACMVLSMSTTSYAYSTVKMGSRRNDVKTLQTMLNTVEGSRLVVDGIFGQATKNAVINFQKKNKLTADGVCGRVTWSALEKQYKAKTTPAKAASTLCIGSGWYSPGTLTVGNVYSFSGTISSNYKITNVCVKIKNSSGSIIQEKAATPNATSYNINKLDNYIKFGKLGLGNYRFIVVAKDASGKTVELVNNAFSVVARRVMTGAELAKATFEVQGKSMCVLTSISMLVKCKLNQQGKDYAGITQQTVKSWNGNVINANFGKIASNANSKSGVSGTLTHASRAKKGAQANKQYVIDLLKKRPEGIVAYFYYNGNNQHAVRICGYNASTDTFYVSDPGGSNMAYVTLQKSRIGNGSYAWKNASNCWAYLNRVIYYQ